MSGNTDKRGSGEQLPVSRMALRLVPYAIRPGQDERAGSPAVVVNYSASFDPLPAGTDFTDLPAPPAADLPGAQLAPLALEIIVRPGIAVDENGNEVLTFSLDSQVQDYMAAGPEQVETQTSLSPWAHDLNSDTIGERVARVHAAEPDERLQRILELADAMMAPLEPGK